MAAMEEPNPTEGRCDVEEKPEAGRELQTEADEEERLGKVKAYIKTHGYLLLIKAIYDNKIDLAISLIIAGASVNTSESPNCTPLHLVLFKPPIVETVRLCKVLLSKGANVNVVDHKTKGTPLHYAAQRRNTDYIRVLLSSPSVDVNISNDKGETPLHVAAQNKNFDCYKLLLMKGACIDACDISGSTAMHVAVSQKDFQIIGLLIEHSATVNISNSKGETPLHIAAQNNDHNICSVLLRKGARLDVCDQSGSTPLHYAAKWRRLKKKTETKVHHYRGGVLYETVTVARPRRALVTLFDCINAENVNVANKRGETPLLIAAKESNIDGCEILLNAGANVQVSDQDGFTPLHYAAVNTSLKSMQLLLSKGANVNASNNKGEQPLHVVVRACHLKKKDDIKAIDGLFGWMDSDRKGKNYYYRETIKLLLANGVEIDAENQEGETALHIAAAGSESLVRELVNNRFNVNAQTKNKVTPLHFAAREADMESLQILLQHGASVNAVNHLNETPLHFACSGRVIDNSSVNSNLSCRNKKIAEHLLKHGAEIHAQDNEGKTALHVASKCSDAEVVALLLSSHANINSLDKSGKTPFSYTSDTAIAKILLQNGAIGNSSPDLLCNAVKEGGERELVEKLLQKGADLNAKNKYGVTALHSVCSRGSENMVRVVLELGADVDICDTNNGATALHFAAGNNIHGNYVISVLLEYGADINDRCEACSPSICVAKTKLKPALQRQLISLQAAGCCVVPMHLIDICCDSLPSFEMQCNQELIALRATKIGNGNTSLHDFLSHRTNKLAVLYRKENVEEDLESGRCTEIFSTFSIYGGEVKRRLEMARERSCLLEDGRNSMIRVTALPDLCIDIISGYLKNSDLKRFMKACQLCKYTMTLVKG